MLKNDDGVFFSKSTVFCSLVWFTTGSGVHAAGFESFASVESVWPFPVILPCRPWAAVAIPFAIWILFVFWAAFFKRFCG